MMRDAHELGAGVHPAPEARNERETAIQPADAGRFRGVERLAREVDQVLGRPFSEFGRGDARDGFYCLGLFLHLVERCAYVELPDPFLDGSAAAVRAFCGRFDALLPCSDLQPLDALFWRTATGEAHVSTVEDRFFSVQVDRAAGVHRAPLRETRARADAVYRLRGLRV